jgi:hypothetical protein
MRGFHSQKGSGNPLQHPIEQLGDVTKLTIAKSPLSFPVTKAKCKNTPVIVIKASLLHDREILCGVKALPTSTPGLPFNPQKQT